MSRKDYVALAEILRETPMADETRAELVSRLVTMLADDNPRFSPSRFRAACSPDSAEPDSERSESGRTPERTPTDLSERDRIEARGCADGHAAGTWVEVPDEDAARRILSMLDEGDPEVYDWLPAPRLGGEYADEPTWADILADEGCEDSDDGHAELYDAYTYAWHVAMEREVVRACRAMLGLVPADLGSR
jgi:hypothetical protein